jgi:competence protein ComEA
MFAPFGLAAESDTNKYDGIEITVNVNSASAQEIATMLKGIGEKKAQDIVDYRTEHGPFKTVDDLSNVKGIGAATLKKNEDRIVL